MFRSRSSGTGTSSSSPSKKKQSFPLRSRTSSGKSKSPAMQPPPGAIIDNGLGIEIRADDIIYEDTKSAYSDDSGDYGLTAVGSGESSSSSSVTTGASASDTGANQETNRLPDGTVVVPLNIEHLWLTEDIAEKETSSVQQAGSTSHCLRSRYGQPVSAKKAAVIMGLAPAGHGAGGYANTATAGLKYHARLIPDDKSVQDKLRRRRILVPKRDIDEDGNIRTRRPLPIVLVSDFMSSLVRVDGGGGPNGQKQPRWIFSGVLNGWPGLTTVELVSITCRTTDKISTMFDNDPSHMLRKNMLRNRLVRLWSAARQGKDGIPPHVHTSVTDRAMEIRVTLRAPPHTAVGYSADSPGLVWWFEGQRARGIGGPRVLHGEDIVRTIQREQANASSVPSRVPVCTHVHMFSHRYATGEKKEQAKDRITYHSAVLLEWDHGRYCTVVELALYNGLGGYAGKCNWYDDKNEDLPELYVAMPPCMIVPWRTDMAEIRCCDVAARNLDEFKEYVKRYTGQKLRFLDPHFTHSNPVRLSFSSKDHIARYLLNYVARDGVYSELNRNCQTFAADFYGFLAGKKGIEPFHPLNRVDYTNRSYHFLYDSSMYDR